MSFNLLADYYIEISPQVETPKPFQGDNVLNNVLNDGIANPSLSQRFLGSAATVSTDSWKGVQNLEPAPSLTPTELEGEDGPIEISLTRSETDEDVRDQATVGKLLRQTTSSESTEVSVPAELV